MPDDLPLAPLSHPIAAAGLKDKARLANPLPGAAAKISRGLWLLQA
jgi:hypothetical protein